MSKEIQKSVETIKNVPVMIGSLLSSFTSVDKSQIKEGKNISSSDY